ncbi:MAG: transcriptional repressor LexA [Vulcanibacillus sp.]
MNKLSSRQREILEFIKSRVKQKGYPPSVREIGEGVGLASSSTVHGHLERLEKKGYIKRDPTKPRAIEIISEELNSNIDIDYVKVPILGKVTAGEPITAIENIEGYFTLPAPVVKNYDVFMLSVQGDSMIEAAILDGDSIIVRKQSTANNGDIVVAMTEDDEVTVKRFFKENTYVRLQPENSSMKPIILRNVSILGIVIGVYREIR